MVAGLNIVVVEDHDMLRDVTVDALMAAGHQVRGVDCAEALEELPGIEATEVYVLDLNLPGEDGISLARRLRRVQPLVGIIMVTARSASPDKQNGYSNGADIYLTKPTSPDELEAAIQALARRLRPHAAQPQTLQLDPARLELRGPAGVIRLSAGECALLAGLARAPGQRLASWQLVELLGKDPDVYAKRSLEVQIVRLRRKLMDVGGDEPAITAIRGEGYQLLGTLLCE